ncbi:hypothetical protein [Streptomyces sp. 8L]|uniref:hypothetical protein n=1 Tax=Streptomyces sp. 8L TaxID=2877242 RepID=UPI001CD74E9A|nr:hypothetical protein [Streptomyces sp. 8L]MCA1218679.1 hypothetical protein [Streptomyces sp. 8L]
MSTPPKPGARPSVRVDQQLSDDLAALMVDGRTVSDAVRQAVAVVAQSYRYAWRTGRVPEGVAPIVGGCYLRCPTPEEQRRTASGQRGQTPSPGSSDAALPAGPPRPADLAAASDESSAERPTSPGGRS